MWLLRLTDYVQEQPIKILYQIVSLVVRSGEAQNGVILPHVGVLHLRSADMETRRAKGGGS